MKTAAAKIILGRANGGMNFVLTLALTLNPLPQERKSPLADSGFADDRPANSVAQIFKETADNSPFPWGEGRVEGERYTKLQPRGKLFALGLSRWDEQKRSVAVPGHSNARTATHFGQIDAGLLCRVAAPGDALRRSGEYRRCQNQFG
jgi:hypothetical protein